MRLLPCLSLSSVVGLSLLAGASFAFAEATPLEPQSGLYEYSAWSRKAGRQRGVCSLTVSPGARTLRIWLPGELVQVRHLTRDGERWRAKVVSGSDSVGLAGEIAGQRASADQVVTEFSYRELDHTLRGHWTQVGAKRTRDFGVEHLTPAGSIRVAITIDWEGALVSPINARAIERLREALPGVPLTHFVSAGYFTKNRSNEELERLAEAIKRQIVPGDELGMLLHPWRSLADAAGVEFRTAPNLLGTTSLMQLEGDEGLEVDLSSYSASDLERFVSTSRVVLTRAGLSLGPAFRSGSYVAPAALLSAVKKHGFTIDASMLTPRAIALFEGKGLLQAKLSELWGQAPSDPHWVGTAHGRLLELPGRGSANQLTRRHLIDIFRDAVRRLRGNPARDVFVHVSFSHETALRDTPLVAAVMQGAISRLGERLVFETASSSAQRARLLLE